MQGQSNGRLKEKKSRNNVYRTNRGSNFLEGKFSNRDNIRAPIHSRREREFRNLKRCFFPKEETHPFPHQ